MRPIDADAVYPWYIKAFSKEEIGDRAIDPRDLRFSMNDIKANLDNIPTLEQELCDDAISRQATLDAIIKRLGIKNEAYLLEAERTIYQQILAMPPVTPQPKTDALDKIKAEIEARLCDVVSVYTDGYRTAIQGALAILDKYKAELKNCTGANNLSHLSHVHSLQ